MSRAGAEELRVAERLGKLPNGWEWRPLANLTTNTERTNPNQQFPDKFFQYVDISSIDNKLGTITTYQTILGQQAPSRARKVIKTKDVILATTRPYLRNIALITSDLNDAICSTGFCVLRVNSVRVLPEYLYYACRSALVIDQLILKQRGVSYPAVTDTDVFGLIIPIPYPDDPVRSLNIQLRLVARIEAMLAEVKESRNLLDQMRSDIEQVMKATLSKVIASLDKQYPHSPTIGDLVSRQYIHLAGGGTPSRSKEHYWIGSIPWVSPKDMKRWYIDDSQEHISPTALQETAVKLIPRYSVLTVVRGMILAHTLPVGVTKTEVTINQDMKALVPDESLLPEYLGYILRARAPSILQQVETAAHGTKRLKTDTLKQVVVPNIKKNEQRRIVEHLDSVESEVNDMQKLLEQDATSLDQLEHSILEQACRGKL